MRNERAAADSRHARTGKDGAFYSEDGVLLATVDTFTSNVNWNNAKYSVLGDAQEHETGKRVKAFYGILEQYGFQFPNDEEKSVAEGTSDLYVKKEC